MQILAISNGSGVVGSWEVYATVNMYTGQVTFHKVPEKHGPVKLVTLYLIRSLA